MKKIVLTGGGTAGHVTPNIALLPSLRELGYEVRYIGSYKGMEKGLIEKEGIPYAGIASGKLRRYHDWKNFTDPFRVIHGLDQAYRILREFKPDVVFSKGGFVAVPVVIAAQRLHIPVIIHESDMTPGLANKLCFRSADKICCNFPETMKYLPKEKRELTGCPIREELLHGDAEKARAFTGLSGKKPVLMVIGGSLGSVAVNKAVREALPEILKKYQVLHICGKGNLDDTLELPGYVQFEYVSGELKDLFALADLVISRAGANVICEILTLHKPNILIPLGTAGSRGDQILNAESFERQGFSTVIREEDITNKKLLEAIDNVYNNREDLSFRMEASQLDDGVINVIRLIEQLASK